MDQFKQWCDYNKLLCAVVIVVVIFLVLYLIRAQSEHMGDPFYLQQMAMANQDPTLFHYTSREKDVAGEDQQDYYTENQMNAETGVGPQYMEGNSQYEPHDDYLGMPAQFRPKIVSTGIVADSKGQSSSTNLKPYMKPRTMVAQQVRAPNTTGVA